MLPDASEKHKNSGIIHSRRPSVASCVQSPEPRLAGLYIDFGLCVILVHWPAAGIDHRPRPITAGVAGGLRQATGVEIIWVVGSRGATVYQVQEVFPAVTSPHFHKHPGVILSVDTPWGSRHGGRPPVPPQGPGHGASRLSRARLLILETDTTILQYGAGRPHTSMDS